MRDQFIISLGLWIIHVQSINPGDIMDDEPIYNAPKIMDQSRVSIITPIL